MQEQSGHGAWIAVYLDEDLHRRKTFLLQALLDTELQGWMLPVVRMPGCIIVIYLSILPII